ncbi:tail protein [Microcystis phage Mae-JY29]
MPFSAISQLDLSELPAPEVVETLDFEVIFAAMLADLRMRDPVFDALVESDPAYKVLQVAAWRELLLRARVNDAARGLMLAFATGGNLDQIGANKGVVRLEGESDTDFRKRIQLSPEGYTTAGSEGAYIFHGLSADPDVKDIQAVSPEPGEVVIYVLSRTGDGTAAAPLLAAVDAALSADTVRPLTDQVTVQSADVTTYAITAELTIYPGPDAEIVRAAAEAAVTAYAAAVHRLGYDVTLSGLYAALHRDGVQGVALTAPLANLVASDGEAFFANAITVTVAGAPDV